MRYCQANRRIIRDKHGFTIMELLIATTVFSVILLVIMTGVMAFSHAYYKGVISSSTQAATRLALERMTEAIQFSGGPVSFARSSPSPSSPIDTYCVGSMQFDFDSGTIQTDTNHVLWMTPRDGGAACERKPFGSSSQDLLSKHMRVNIFTVTSSATGLGAGQLAIEPGTLLTVQLRVLYGDNDLLVSPSGATPIGTAPDARCKPQSASQYCTISNLISTVEKRVQ